MTDKRFVIISEHGTGNLYGQFRRFADMSTARALIVEALREFADQIEAREISAESGLRFTEPGSTSQDDGQVIENNGG